MAAVMMPSVCHKVMAVSDLVKGIVVATMAIGQGPNGVALDDGYLFRRRTSCIWRPARRDLRCRIRSR